MIDDQENLLKSFISLGLTESQEETLTQSANEFMKRMVSTQDRSLDIVSQLEEVGAALARLAKD